MVKVAMVTGRKSRIWGYMSRGERVCMQGRRIASQGGSFPHFQPHGGVGGVCFLPLAENDPDPQALTPEVMMTVWNRSKTGLMAMEASMQLEEEAMVSLA